MNPSSKRYLAYPSSNGARIATSSRGAVEVVSPSRLHFGLLSFGHRHERQYGGVGMMVDQPVLRVIIRPAPRTDWKYPIAWGERIWGDVVASHGVSPDLRARTADFVIRWLRHLGASTGAEFRQFEISLESAPPQHCGLGAGTQLGLSVGAGLHAFFGLPQPSPGELAESVGRGLRSAVGTYGFAQGGLIVERGKRADEQIAPLECRLQLPDAWRAVLIQPPSFCGLSGVAEQRAFDDLPPVPPDVTRRLWQEIHVRMLPAARRGQFQAFSESVYRYGRLAGMCFAALQGGPYNGPHLERLVNRIRAWGVCGVGQSSWGPTLFALAPDPAAAEALRQRLVASSEEPAQILISRLNHQGARIRDFK